MRFPIFCVLILFGINSQNTFSKPVKILSASDTITWVGGTGTGSTKKDWSTAGNWSSGALPTSINTVIINNVTNQPVISATAQVSCKNLVVNNSATLTIKSNSSTANTNLSIYGDIKNDGTISYTGSQTQTGNYVQLYSTLGTISGTGTYSSIPFYFNNTSNYTANNSFASSILYIDDLASLTLNCPQLDITKGITQNGFWYLGSATVTYSATGTSSTAPYFTSTKFFSQTSLFYYNATSGNQYVTDAIYYNLKINNNSTNKVRVGTGGLTQCHDFTILQGTAVTTGYVNLYYQLNVSGNLSIGIGCKFTVNDGSTDWPIYLGGDFTNNGTFVAGTGANSFGVTPPATLLLNGTIDQNISGSSSTTFYNLTILKSGLTKTYINQDSVIVSNILSLGTGIIDLNAKTLKLSLASTGALTTTTGYIISENTAILSKLKRNVSNVTGIYSFPFGKSGGSLIPFTFQLTSGNAGIISVATYQSNANNLPLPPTVTNLRDSLSGNDDSGNMVDRYWQIDKTGAGGVANITFTYVNSENPSNSTGGPETNLRAQRFSGTNWQRLSTIGTGQINDTIANTVKVFGVTQFSPWTLVKGIDPLPVELISFTAKESTHSVELNWTTATEINNQEFVAEKSDKEMIFTPIHRIKGAGNSQTKKDYSAIDYFPADGKNYYRLKQIDFDGRVNYSEIISADFKLSNKSFITLNEKELTANLFDLIPRTTYSFQVCSLNNTTVSLINRQTLSDSEVINFDLKDLPKGIYLLKVSSDSDQRVFKFIL